ncbi:MAG: hypothetical protein WBL50_20645 [Candidatus Acidiferrum sp.]
MQQPDSPAHRDPLDLLRRFIPTPLRAVYRIGSHRVMVQTNDFTLLPALTLEANSNTPTDKTLEWKLIRDMDSPGLLESPTLMTSSALTVVAMGTACLLGLDHVRRELVGFIGSGIDARTHQEFIVPFLCRMTSEALFAGPVTGSNGQNEESANE